MVVIVIVHLVQCRFISPAALALLLGLYEYLAPEWLLPQLSSAVENAS